MATVQGQYRAAVGLGRSLASPAPMELLVAGRLCDTMPGFGVDLAAVPSWPGLEAEYGLSTDAYIPSPNDGLFRAALETATLGITQRALASDEPLDLGPETVTAYCLQGIIDGTNIERFRVEPARAIVRGTLATAMQTHEQAGTRVDYAHVEYLQRVMDGGEFGNMQTTFQALRRRINNWRCEIGDI